jgi:hypothetical protein
VGNIGQSSRTTEKTLTSRIRIVACILSH